MRTAICSRKRKYHWTIYWRPTGSIEKKAKKDFLHVGRCPKKIRKNVNTKKVVYRGIAVGMAAVMGGVPVSAAAADVSKEEECQKLVEYSIKKYNKIDILVNNAGIDKYQLITEVTKKDWEEIINTNLYSAFCMCQKVLPNMIHNKNGCIINISSIWGIVGASTEVVYSISKAGIDGLTKALAKEVGPSNIRVNSIAPGYIETDINKDVTKEEKEEILKEIPLEKTGEPKEIAKCVNWLVEDDYTTGQIISINGGWVIT